MLWVLSDILEGEWV